MINPQWLKVSTSTTNFGSPKDVRAIDVRLVGYCQVDYLLADPLVRRTLTVARKVHADSDALISKIKIRSSNV